MNMSTRNTPGMGIDFRTYVLVTSRQSAADSVDIRAAIPVEWPRVLFSILEVR
jgi:hypothetical protein